MKILNFFEIFKAEKILNIWNIEIFGKFWTFMIFLKELFPFWGTQWVVYQETIGLLPGKQLVVSRLD